jgi:Fe-S oxidoreductase
MKNFDWFVVPFAIGFYGMILILLYKIWQWWKEFSSTDKKKVASNILTVKTIKAIGEIISESLLHRKIFKINFRLGWMHMTFALGWLLLIVVGKFQTTACTGDWANHVWYAIFFRYFESQGHHFYMSGLFEFVMDAILLFILTGVGMAWFKRIRSRALGLKNTTQHATFDRIAVTFIWLIFPIRLIAESLTCGAFGGGSFLTASLGNQLAVFLPVEQLYYPAWWAYSIVLGTFFIALPFSRYMHIPAEIALIAFRKWEVDAKSLIPIEIESCSRCGICIDGCAMTAAGKKTQAVYAVRQIRSNTQTAAMAHGCMSCGSCEQRCPVGINLNRIRMGMKADKAPVLPVKVSVVPQKETSTATGVVYIPGCIGSLTPSVTKAMSGIMYQANESFKVIGHEDDNFCCGRPLLLAGKTAEAQQIIETNSHFINNLKAKTIVTSCPVCYKMFTEQYQLNAEVLHHTQYIERLVNNHAIQLSTGKEKLVFHDPCELGRGKAVYDSPRNVLNHTGTLLKHDNEREASLCCGGSLSGFPIAENERNKVAQATVDVLEKQGPNRIVTACSMCKKTLAQHAHVPVKDIAEVVWEHCSGNSPQQPTHTHHQTKTQSVTIS